jgi:hypothetical protein
MALDTPTGCCYIEQALDFQMKLNLDIRNAISSFAGHLIAGDLGPDDSRYSRDDLFLKHPSVVREAMVIFLHHLDVDRLLTSDEAEQRVRQYIVWKNYGDEPEAPFTKEELGNG